MRKFAQVISVLTLIAMFLGAPPIARAESAAHAPGFSTAYELISAVNALRTTYGLAPYQTNSILMGIAQTQAEYLVAIGVSNVHTDANGLLPYQRALAAGYMVAGDLSNGKPGWFSENVVGGAGLDADGAVELWMGDAPHRLTMLSDTLQDVGAGVGVHGNTYYYVLDCGLSTGGTPVAYTPPAPLHSSTPTFVPNTPNADGSIIHMVQSGDTTLGIALAYHVPWEDVLKLNGLTEKSVIYIGQEIIIQAAYTPTPTQPTGTPTKRPTITPWPTSLPTATATSIPATSTPSLTLPAEKTGGVAIVIIAAALVIAGLFSLLGRQRKG